MVTILLFQWILFFTSLPHHNCEPFLFFFFLFYNEEDMPLPLRASATLTCKAKQHFLTSAETKPSCCMLVPSIGHREKISSEWKHCHGRKKIKKRCHWLIFHTLKIFRKLEPYIWKYFSLSSYFRGRFCFFSIYCHPVKKKKVSIKEIWEDMENC